MYICKNVFDEGAESETEKAKKMRDEKTKFADLNILLCFVHRRKSKCY